MKTIRFCANQTLHKLEAELNALSHQWEASGPLIVVADASGAPTEFIQAVTRDNTTPSEEHAAGKALKWIRDNPHAHPANTIAVINEAIAKLSP
jgi:hypothetical protein